MSIKDRLIQFVLRGKDELSPEAKKSAEALEQLKDEAGRLGKALDDAKGAQGLAKGLENTRRAAEQSERALVQAGLQIKDLRDALNKNPEGAGLAQSLKDAEREGRRLHHQLDSLNDELARQEKAARDAGINTDQLGDEQTRLAAEVSKAGEAVKANAAELKNLEREQSRAARGAAEHRARVEAARESMSRGAKQVLAFAAAYVSLNAAFGLVQKGLNALSGGLRAALGSASQEEQALGQLEAALASTGNAAGLTAKELRAMASEIGRNAMLTDEQILSAQTRLLSYTDIARNEFPRALQIAIDQQQRLGISAEQSAEIVGRALQSPTEAMATLGRQGFKFTEQQEKMLRVLERTGQKAKAQAVIMDMLTEAYGGAAAAARLGSFEGLLKSIGDRFDDFGKRVAASGAFEYVKKQLLGLADYIDQMDRDGRLDRLAKSLSNAFEQGAEKVKELATRLLDVDFAKLTEDSSSWLDTFGEKIDAATQRVTLFVAPFRTLFNGLTSGLSTLLVGVTQFVDGTLAKFELIAQALPEAMGGEKLQAAIADAREAMKALGSGLLEQIEQDGKDIADAWDTTGKAVTDSAEAQAEAQKRAAADAAAEQERLAKEAADAQVAEQQRVTDAAIAAAIEGTAAIEGMANAVDLIQTSGSVAQLEGLRAAMLRAYQDGKLSQEEYANASNLLNTRLKELQGGASAAAAGVSDLEEALADLKQVQQAISGAQTDVDINNIRTALRKLYNDGQISAKEYNQALKDTSAKQRELKGEVERGEKAQRDKNAADKEAIKTTADLRRESGKRMEQERKASGEAMTAARQAGDALKRDAGGATDFFSGVVTRAREGVEALSGAAGAALAKLLGFNKVKVGLDTSSLDATRKSVQQVTDELSKLQQAASMPGLNPLSKWAMDTQSASLQVQQSYLSQKSSVQSLIEQYERGTLSAREFSKAARGLAGGMNLLNESDLSALQSAISAAEQRMKALGESTRSTLESLQDELDGLQGRTEDIERRRFSARRRELEAQLAEAQSGGDSQAVANASRALGMLRQIESEAEQARQAEQQKTRMNEASKQQEANKAAQPTKVIRLEVPGKSPVDVAVQSDADETKLLDVLAAAGLRSF